jgi:hypothetical protein
MRKTEKKNAQITTSLLDNITKSKQNILTNTDTTRPYDQALEFPLGAIVVSHHIE